MASLLSKAALEVNMNQALPFGRRSATADTERVRKLGNLSLDLDTFRLAVDGRSINLTYREGQLLRLLLEQPDRIVAYDLLTTAVWGSTGRRTTRHLHVVVHGLRAKLSGSHPYRLETVRGRGYGLLKAASDGQADASPQLASEAPEPPSRKAR